MRRFRVEPDPGGGSRVLFELTDAHHLARVLRLGPGDLVQALDGRGHDVTVRLVQVDAQGAAGVVVAGSARRTESPVELTLAQGIPKGDKLERIIGMATELGVQRVVPLLTARTIARPDPGRWPHRLERCRRVAREAAKQSGRAVVPEIDSPRSLEEWLAASRPAGLLLCLWEGEAAGLTAVLPAGGVERASVVVGPEGGLSEAEVAELRAAGAVVAGLGPRILRTETAGPVALALLQSRYGDLGSGA